MFRNLLASLSSDVVADAAVQVKLGAGSFAPPGAGAGLKYFFTVLLSTVLRAFRFALDACSQPWIYSVLRFPVGLHGYNIH